MFNFVENYVCILAEHAVSIYVFKQMHAWGFYY